MKYSITIWHGYFRIDISKYTVWSNSQDVDISCSSCSPWTSQEDRSVSFARREVLQHQPAAPRHNPGHHGCRGPSPTRWLEAGRREEFCSPPDRGRFWNIPLSRGGETGSGRRSQEGLPGSAGFSRAREALRPWGDVVLPKQAWHQHFRWNLSFKALALSFCLLPPWTLVAAMLSDIWWLRDKGCFVSVQSGGCGIAHGINIPIYSLL